MNPAQSGRPAYVSIHYGDVGTPPRVLCASSATSTPVTRDWRYVTCLACLRLGDEKGSPTARRVLEERLREAQETD